MCKMKTRRDIGTDGFGILLLSPYAYPRYWPRRRVGVQVLLKLGLLERDPTAPNFYRCTEKGEELVALWTKDRM